MREIHLSRHQLHSLRSARILPAVVNANLLQKWLVASGTAVTMVLAFVKFCEDINQKMAEDSLSFQTY